jgi:Zn-dependent alcohol dehydrogenase
LQAFQLVESQKPPELREMPVPEPGPGQVLVKVAGAGACHSDLHIMERPQARPSSPSPSAMRTRAGSRSWDRGQPGTRLGTP